jgi:hypothetical protein
VLNPGSEVPAPKAMELHVYPDTLIKKELLISDGIARGEVKKVEWMSDYDVNCHLPTQFLGCKPQSAWRIELKNVKSFLWAFPIPGQYLPIAPPMSAIFFVRSRWIIPVAKCFQMSQFTQTCLSTQGEMALVVEDTLDILPMADSAVVDSLRKVLRR